MDSQNVISCGNAGPKVRSDCRISFEQTTSGGIQIELKSKVKTMYGDNILKLTNEVVGFYGIEHCNILIEDAGALSLTLAARLEAAIRKATGSEKEFLLPVLPQNNYKTEKDRYRFSRLYLPGNSPQLFINAGIHHPDGIILDLEDAVAHDKKYEAGFLVRNALRNVDFYGCERMVRINQIPRGLDDLPFIVNHGVHLILVPKCESADQLHQVNNRIQELLNDKTRKIWLMPIIESALGVMRAYEIASAADNVVALAIGLEDFTADMGIQRTREGGESFVARNMLAMACKASGIAAIDSVFSDVDDSEGLINAIKVSKSLGFTGMGCIHPRQIRIIHEFYGPEDAEVEKAKKIVLAFDDATARGLGVVSLGSKMIDPPVVKRAITTIDVAIKTGKLNANWKEEVNNEVR
ncbi:MAG: citrate lyase ACP [Bacteroidetes bacterium HGW-Bacteroidetes-6]|jgi:citrate lyase subunit beta/citryl-CoA lyase|nr:MAG: citrate lyase ACP [Bacteroidetes bacterium HGW-Bacteroidetes-6]